MRKVLLTVMMVSSLLAFNACKKDGAVGPAGPAGATGPAGPAGAVGPAGAAGVPGAAGAAGSKILGLTVDPTTEGVVGDYAFNSTTRTLFGPKTAAGWGTGTSLVGATGATGAAGATGATGATGAAGTKFIANNGAPDATTAPNAVTGDFYFDKSTGVFYGPKLADGTWANTMPLGSSYAAKRVTFVLPFVVTAGTKAFGEDLIPTYTNYNIFSSYMVSANDMIRVNQYPVRTVADAGGAAGTGGWGENREMVFESAAGSNVFNSVPTAYTDLGRTTAEIANNIADVSLPNMRVGAKFRYSKNTVNPLAEFTLTQEDIDKLKVNNGASFEYLTYAKALQSSVAQGQNLVLATTKNVQVKTSTTKYFVNHTAKTSFDLNTMIANYSDYKQNGKLWVKFKYHNAATALPGDAGNTAVNHTGIDAGWVDLTYYANSYVTPTTAGSGIFGTQNPFTTANPTTHPYAAGNYPGSGNAFAVLGNPITFAPLQVATPVAHTVGNGGIWADGKFVQNWTIASGTNAGLVNTYIGPDRLVANAIPAAYNTVDQASKNPFGPAAAGTSSFDVRGFATNYYSAATGTLTATDNGGLPIALGGVNFTNVNGNKGGLEASAIAAQKLVTIQILALTSVEVAKAKDLGIDINDATAMENFAKKNNIKL